MYWNVFHRPKFSLSNKVRVAVSTFDVEDEDLVREIFHKRFLGQDIITTSSHPTRELSYQQIYMMEDAIESHTELYEPSLMCRQCGENPVSILDENALCCFCQYENEQEPIRRMNEKMETNTNEDR